MRFTTLTFLVFFLAFYIVYWTLRPRARLPLIVVGSLVFYAAWSLAFSLHFFGMVVLNYWLIEYFLRPAPSRRRITLILIVNFGNLFLFKYFYFFLGSLYDGGLLLGEITGADLAGIKIFQEENFNAWMENASGIKSIVLPLAISFYTFQLTAYAVDVYRGRIPERSRPLEFFTFILFFPQLIAGPIMRHSDFFHQLREIRPDENKTLDGMFLLAQGVIKKVVIADNIAPLIAPIFNNPELYDWRANFMAAAGFSVRVYCDFSGYTDIARGLGKLLGLELPENFRAPYLSASFREVWTRWHVTLSTWIRDYVYIPLGGSRYSEIRNFFTIVLAFALSGLWHGAAYTYLVWGMLHGVFLAVERSLRRSRDHLLASWSRRDPSAHGAWETRVNRPWVRFIRRVSAVSFIFLSWILVTAIFNAPGLSEAFTMLWRIFSFAGEGLAGSDNKLIGGMLLVTILLNFLQARGDRPLFQERKARYALAFGMCLLTAVLLGHFSPGGRDFIYFRF